MPQGNDLPSSYDYCFRCTVFYHKGCGFKACRSKLSVYKSDFEGGNPHTLSETGSSRSGHGKDQFYQDRLQQKERSAGCDERSHVKNAETCKTPGVHTSHTTHPLTCCMQDSSARAAQNNKQNYKTYSDVAETLTTIVSHSSRI